MAKMVTRTIEVTTVEIMLVNTETMAVATRTLGFHSFKSIRKPLDFLKEKCENETTKVVTYKELETVPVTYGCTEEDFLSIAKPIER